MLGLINAVLTSLVVSVVLFFPLREILKAPATKKENFRGYLIPGSAGLLVPTSVTASLAIAVLEGARVPVGWVPFIAYVFFVCLMGFADDVLGDRRVTGIRGHFRELARGRFTSGALKAFSGFAAGVVIAGFFATTILELLLDAAVLALALNSFNSLDLRPGRAIKVFLLVIIAITIAGWGTFVWPAYSLALPPILVLLWADLRLETMLGDAGSNVLGAIAGYTAVATLNWVGNLVILVALALFHLYTETRSVSELVLRVRWLRWFDELGLKKR